MRLTGELLLGVEELYVAPRGKCRPSLFQAAEITGSTLEGKEGTVPV